NARRAACDLRGADEALTTAYGFYHEGSRTTLRLAKLLDYEGSLRRDQRRFDHALVCLDRALEIYRNSGAAPHLAGKILIKRATVYDQACQPDRAVPLLRQALALIDSEIEPCLLYSAYQNLGVCLCEIERYDEAARLLPLLEDLVAESDRRMDRARLEWLRGRISSGTGD
ncbi:MAG: tetratricopeptide repeat protein, partial [Bosea sp.]|uniref:tetratricopeptide repeat protein n=1 Tax=Bosea sp. (in: a-proteobacteria) TaxID=1871050 RepID=UPI0031FE486F|nr:tetratricopeptide repeat protein [Bosea sp. (in: a-proteobacteria)]